MSHSQFLPDRASLEFLKDQAKRLLKSIRASDDQAVAITRKWHPKYCQISTPLVNLALHDTQLVIARQHGFVSWSKLKEEIERRNSIQLSPTEKLVKAVLWGALEETQMWLAQAELLQAEVRTSLAQALTKIVNRSVWHRPQYHAIVKLLVASGVECSLWDAARAGLLAHVRFLIGQNPSLINSKDEKGRTALQRAALIYGSHPECEATVAWLLANGAEVDIFTASAYSMTTELKTVLLKNPVAIHQKCEGSTPLNWAVRPRKEDGGVSALEPCSLLIKAGADIETRDDHENGMHPLHHVAEWGNNILLADLLITNGANLNAKDNIGWTPLDYAVDRERTTVANSLRKHGAVSTITDHPSAFPDQIERLIASTKRNDVESVQQQIEKNSALARERQTDGATALHWAAHDGLYEIAELLLRYGADVSLQETKYWGGTPLHWAAERQPALVALLLDHGAEINVRNSRTGQTPLHYCARCDDVPEVAELLIKRGANILARDHLNFLPLDYAQKSGHTLVEGILLSKSLPT